MGFAPKSAEAPWLLVKRVVCVLVSLAKVDGGWFCSAWRRLMGASNACVSPIFGMVGSFASEMMWWYMYGNGWKKFQMPTNLTRIESAAGGRLATCSLNEGLRRPASRLAGAGASTGSGSNFAVCNSLLVSGSSQAVWGLCKRESRFISADLSDN